MKAFRSRIPLPRQDRSRYQLRSPCLYRKKINLSTSLTGQAVGIKEVDDGMWLVSFIDYDRRLYRSAEKNVQPLDNPFGPKVLSMC